MAYIVRFDVELELSRAFSSFLLYTLLVDHRVCTRHRLHHPVLLAALIALLWVTLYCCVPGCVHQGGGDGHRCWSVGCGVGR